jgi:hypothetical protein
LSEETYEYWVLEITILGGSAATMSRTRKSVATVPGPRRNPLAALKMADVYAASKPRLPAGLSRFFAWLKKESDHA